MGNVYFIQAGDRVKIGFAKDVAARLAQLQTGNACRLKLLAVIPNGSHALERRLHAFFAEHRVRNEWFQFSGNMATLIKSIREGAKPYSEAEIAHYAQLKWKKAPLRPDEHEAQVAFGRLMCDVRRAARDKTRPWVDIRAELIARGGRFEEAVEAFERRGLDKVRKRDPVH
jgi:hypothetical protein